MIKPPIRPGTTTRFIQLLLVTAFASPLTQANGQSLDTLTTGTLKALPKPLGLLEAWGLAVENDPTFRAAQAAAAAGREVLPQAWSQLLPNATISASNFRNDVDRKTLDILSQSVSTQSRYTSRNETLMIRQPLLREPQRIAIRQAEHQVNEFEAVLEQEYQNLAVRVATAYFELMFANDQARLLASQSDFLQARLNAANRAITSGTGTRTDRDDAQARFDLNRAQRLEAAQAIQARRRRLQALVNRPIGDLTPLDPALLSLAAPEPASAEEWVAMAIDTSPEVRIVRARLGAADARTGIAQAGHYPTVDAIAQLQRSSNEVVSQPQTGYTNASVGLQMNLPLYSGGLTSSTVREALAQKVKANELLEATQLDLSVRVHSEFNAITEGIERVRALEVAVRSAAVALDSARKSVTAGTRTSLDELNALQQQGQVLSSLAQARYGLLLARVRLLALAGRIEEAAISKISASLR